VTPATQPEAKAASPLRAWCYLVGLCLQRQARTRQLVWIALALFGLTWVVVILNTLAQRWGMDHWRYPHRVGPTYQQWIERTSVLPSPAAPADLRTAVLGAAQALLDRSGFLVFSSWIVFSVFMSFLLPIWSLSFATDALGGEREDRTLIWLLTLPQPRPLVYLAKFVALLPYTLGLNLGGFGLLCLAAGRPGMLAFQLYWPGVLCASLAFCALFHLLSACFRRATVVALVYAFFLETLLGNMPGYMKRVSISFYARCMMFERAQDYGVQPEKPSIYLPVDGPTAMSVLLGATIVLLFAGMVVFSRSEYQDLS
jgi:ABC-type Na+ efflux pump permease subunit